MLAHSVDGIWGKSADMTQLLFRRTESAGVREVAVPASTET
jgi:hypothetical protein